MTARQVQTTAMVEVAFGLEYGEYEETFSTQGNCEVHKSLGEKVFDVEEIRKKDSLPWNWS